MKAEKLDYCRTVSCKGNLYVVRRNAKAPGSHKHTYSVLVNGADTLGPITTECAAIDYMHRMILRDLEDKASALSLMLTKLQRDIDGMRAQQATLSDLLTP